eukprot:10944371-Ditylum_brightwellii.AAC.1
MLVFYVALQEKKGSYRDKFVWNESKGRNIKHIIFKTGNFTAKDGDWMNQFIKMAVIQFHHMVMNFSHQNTGSVFMQACYVN